MNKLLVLALCLLGTLAQSQTRMSSYQVGTDTNHLTAIAPTNDSVEAVIEWIDDNWPTIDSSGWTNILPVTSNDTQSAFDWIDGWLSGFRVSSSHWDTVTAALTNSMAWVTNNMMMGTNITEATYDGTNTWTQVPRLRGTNIVGATYDAGTLTWTVQTNAIDPVSETTGFIVGAVPRYASATTVTVSPGITEVQGLLVTNAQQTVSITPVGSRDLHYFYLNSTGLVTSSTTEPAFEADGSGWYSGGARCIGAVREAITNSVILPYVVERVSGRRYTVRLALPLAQYNLAEAGGGNNDEALLASAVTMNEKYQAMNINDLDEMVPVCAVAAQVGLATSALGSWGIAASFMHLSSSEVGASAGVTNVGYRILGYSYGLDDTLTEVRVPFHEVSANLVVSVGPNGGSTTGNAVFLFGWECVR